MGVIADIASIPLSIWQTNQNSNVAKYNTDQANKENRELAKYQYSQEQKMWEQQNAYNSPSAQMDRFAKAGLNKNLIYGQGSPGNATVLPKYSAPKMEYNYIPKTNLPQVLSLFTDLAQKNAQTDNLRAQKDVIEQVNIGKKLENVLNEATMGYDIEYKGWRGLGEKWRQRKGYYDAESSYYNSEIRKKDLANYEEKLYQTLQNLESRTGYTNKQTDWYDNTKIVNLLSNALGIPLNFLKAFRKPK